MKAAQVTAKKTATVTARYEDYATPLDLIGGDGYFSIRGGVVDPKHVAALAARIRDGGALDPVLLWQGPKGLVVLDGTHRLEAYRKARWTDRIPARIVECDRPTALLLAIQANSKVTLVMTNAERWNLAWRLVREVDREGAALFSKRQISGATGTSTGTVDNMRARLASFLVNGMEPTGNWLRDRKADPDGHWEGLTDEEAEAMIEDLARELRRTFNVRGVRNDQVLAEALLRAVGETRLAGWIDHLYPSDDDYVGDDAEDEASQF